MSLGVFNSAVVVGRRYFHVSILPQMVLNRRIGLDMAFKIDITVIDNSGSVFAVEFRIIYKEKRVTSVLV